MTFQYFQYYAYEHEYYLHPESTTELNKQKHVLTIKSKQLKNKRC